MLSNTTKIPHSSIENLQTLYINFHPTNDMIKKLERE